MLHDTRRRPRTLLDLTQGLSVLTKVPHQHSNCFNHVGIPRTVPSQFVATSKRYPPDPGQDLQNSQATHNSKASIEALRYTSLYKMIPSRVASSVIGGSGTDCLTLVREMSRKQESPPSFIFSKWKGQKHRKIPYRDCSRFGRQIIEREGVSTLSIHGYPWALRYLLIVFSKMVCLLFNVGLKKFL